MKLARDILAILATIVALACLVLSIGKVYDQYTRVLSKGNVSISTDNLEYTNSTLE